MRAFVVLLLPILKRILAIVLALAIPAFAMAQGTDSDVEMSKISGDPKAPRRHFRLLYPAALSPQRAGETYSIIRQALQGGYARSGSATAANYQGWRRFNTAPYLSSTHGNHYLNNYVNEIGAAAYGRFEKAGKLPVGTIVAKDSFSMTRGGEILLGGLFVMEKMPAGFSYVSGDWKYTLVQADGTLFGETNGTGSKRVEYCIECHLAVERQDHLWFLPRRYRVPAGEIKPRARGDSGRPRCQRARALQAACARRAATTRFAGKNCGSRRTSSGAARAAAAAAPEASFPSPAR